jgi:hypothetical protein
MHVRGCNGWQRRHSSSRRYEWTWHSFRMLVGQSRTCDVSALRLCLFPLELMNGREIATAVGLRL